MNSNFIDNQSVEIIDDNLCLRCETRKPLDQFCNHKWKNDGLNIYCRTCVKERTAEKACTVSVSEKKCTRCKQIKPISEFYNNKRHVTGFIAHCRDCSRWITLKTVYGITKGWYESTLIAQKGVCAICKTPSVDSLHVDHNHANGNVRGLLCSKCNMAIGLISENVESLESAIKYLSIHKTV